MMIAEGLEADSVSPTHGALQLRYAPAASKKIRWQILLLARMSRAVR